MFITSVGLISCNDFLTEDPEMKQSNELTLSDYKGLDKATSANYGYLYDDTWYGANFILSAELRSGNAKNPTMTTFTSGRYTTEYNWAFADSYNSGPFVYAYRLIAGANNVINNLEDKTSTSVSQADLNNLKAENLFLRALGHFDLVRTYAQPYTYQPNSLGVPVLLVTENGLPARNTVAEVYNQVVTDLLEAESLIGDGFVRSGITDKLATVTKEAIQGLLSRVYLYMGEWQKSADYATKVINSGKFNMYTADELEDIWTLNIAEEGKEVIFEIFGAKANEYNGYWEEISWLTSPGTGAGDRYSDVASSADLRNIYDDNDVRGSLFITTDDAPADHWWTSKYAGKTDDRPCVNNIIVLRLSEMYLNRAEAIVNGASVAGVTTASDLKVITSNRGASDATPTKTGVLLERRKELAFEGHHIYDLARNQLSLSRDVDYTGAPTAQYIEFPSWRWALPIPKPEVDANPNMVQNDGY